MWWTSIRPSLHLVRATIRRWAYTGWLLRFRILASTLVLFLTTRLALYLWYLDLPADHPSILCSFGEGRLGNQLSSLASMISFSEQYGMKAVVTRSQATHLSFYFEPERLDLQVLEEEYASFFITVLGWSLCRLRWITPWSQVSHVDNHFNYSVAKEKHLHTGHAINMGEYPNVVESFKPLLPLLRQRFSLRAKFKDVAQLRLHAALRRRGLMEQASEVSWVGVHNRRGDYGHHLNKLYNLPMLGPDFFLRAMQHFTKKLSGLVVFVIVSDDLLWARHHFSNTTNQVEFLGHSAVLPKDINRPLATGVDVGEDLALLAACNHSIISYGTFGMWAAILAGGEVVTSSTMARTKEGGELKAANLPNWVVLEPEKKNAAEKNLKSKAVVVSRLSYFLLTCLLVIEAISKI